MVSTGKPASNGEAGASEPFDAFVSYSHADKRYGLRIQRFLESARLPRSRGASRRRLKVFRDDTDIRAAQLDTELGAALARSRALVVCCSPRASQADWVRQEIELFLKQGAERPIVPVLVDGEPAAAIPATIASYRYVDVRGAWKFGWLRPAARDELLRAVAIIAGEDLRTFIPWDRRRRRRRFAAASALVVVAAIAMLLFPFEHRRAFPRPASIAPQAVIEFCDVVEDKLVVSTRETHVRGTLEEPSDVQYVKIHPDVFDNTQKPLRIETSPYLPAGRLLHVGTGQAVRKRIEGMSVTALRGEALKSVKEWQPQASAESALEPGFWGGAPTADVRIMLVAIKPSKLHPDAAEGPLPVSSVVAIKHGDAPVHVQLLDGLYAPAVPKRGAGLEPGFPLAVTSDAIFIGMAVPPTGGVGGLWKWDRRYRRWERENFSNERGFGHGNVYSIVTDPGRPGRVLLSTAPAEWATAAQKGRYAAQMFERPAAGQPWRLLSPVPVETDSKVQLCGFRSDGTLFVRVDQALYASGPYNLLRLLRAPNSKNP
jgi:hypothetical protein